MIEILNHGFVQNAFFAGVIVAVISGFVGYFVVLRGQAFTCEALSHVGFTGALGAALVGASSLEGMFLFTVIAAIGMGALGKRLSGQDIEAAQRKRLGMAKSIEPREKVPNLPEMQK